MVGDIQLLVKKWTQTGANGMELKKMIISQGEKYSKNCEIHSEKE